MRDHRFSAEERRLREWLLARSSRRRVAAVRGGVRAGGRPAGIFWLIVAAPLVVFLLAAERNNAVIGHAGLLAILVVIGALLGYAGFTRRPDRVWTTGWQYRSRAAFVALLACIAVTAYFGIRERRSIDELARVIAPVPDVEDVMYIPTGPELQAIALALAPFSGDLGAATGEYPSIRYWKLETSLDAEAVVAFYEEAQNRQDWRLVHVDPPYIEMRRDGEQLILFITSRMDGGQAVWYIHRDD